MADLVRMSVRDQLGAADPAVSGRGATVRLLDPAAQFYVTDSTSANTVRGDDPYSLWLAPDRCLLVSEHARPPTEGFASDVTDGLALFEIAGPRAGEIISASCTLDPAGPDLAPGRCAQTMFGGVRVVLYAHGSDGRFRLHVERQLAAFLLEWLRQAASALG